jgi:hypothetical protein
MRAQPAVRGLSFAVLISGVLAAQESRPDAARRLHEIVDQKIEALRAELHREIDKAFKIDASGANDWFEPPAGLELAPAPASAEFHAVHRLRPGIARRVEAVAPGSEAQRRGILAGDVFLRAPGVIGGIYRVIRRNEIIDPGPAREETTAQMVDRMWDEAVQKQLRSGLEPIRTGQSVPESQPVRK